MKFEFPLSRQALVYRVVFWLCSASALLALYMATKLLDSAREDLFLLSLAQAVLCSIAMILTKQKMIALDGAGLTGIRIRRNHS